MYLILTDLKLTSLKSLYTNLCLWRENCCLKRSHRVTSFTVHCEWQAMSKHKTAVTHKSKWHYNQLCWYITVMSNTTTKMPNRSRGIRILVTKNKKKDTNSLLCAPSPILCVCVRARARVCVHAHTHVRNQVSLCLCSSQSQKSLRGKCVGSACMCSCVCACVRVCVCGCVCIWVCELKHCIRFWITKNKQRKHQRKCKKSYLLSV